jgi:hypothetical protein
VSKLRAVALKAEETGNRSLQEIGLVPWGRSARGKVIRKELRTCPVQSLHDWLEAARITAGPGFRRIVKRAAARAGLEVDTLGAYSLRAALPLKPPSACVPENLIRCQTGIALPHCSAISAG